MKWMNVKELAKYLKLSEMMVYKLAQRGNIPASKIGSIWRFSETEIDEWLLRKKGGSDSVIKDFIAGLKKEFGKNLSAVILFGSYVRGEADQYSDIDLLVVFQTLTDYWKIKSQVEALAYSNTFEKNRPVVIAPVIMTESEYLTGTSPLLLNIRKEGQKAA